MKIVITVSGGIVQDVYSSNTDVEIEIVDFDCGNEMPDISDMHAVY